MKLKNDSKTATEIIQLASQTESGRDKLSGSKEYLDNLIQIAEFNVIGQSSYLEIEALKNSIDLYENGLIWKLLKHSKREISMYYEDKESGLKFKIRPDAIQFSENIGLDAIISVKTTRRQEIEEFWRYDFFGMKYDRAEAFYQDVASKVTGRDFSTTLLIVLQTVPPFDCTIILVPDQVIQDAHRLNADRLDEYQTALASGHFAGWVDAHDQHEGILILE